MSDDAPGPGGTPDDEDDPAASFLAGVRDAYLRPDGGRPAGDSPTPPGVGGPQAGSHPDTGAGDGRPAEGSRGGVRAALDESCPVTAALREAPELGRVAHVGPATDRRYGTERRVRCTIDGVSRRVDARACRHPETDREGFAGALRTQLHRWATVSDVEGVVPVLDRGGGDRPWLVTASTGPTLCGRDTPSVARALRQATRLSAALVALHERGVVHAGIDPGNVVLTAGTDGPPRPALTNPGLVDVYRRYEDPAAVLDPRYAPPEFFAAEPGVVDRATDVYGLGAVVFRLLTGVAPIAGSAETIAERVTADEPLPRPSRVAPRLPEAVDDVVLTATATDKFERFDTARDLHEALLAVRDRR